MSLAAFTLELRGQNSPVLLATGQFQAVFHSHPCLLVLTFSVEVNQNWKEMWLYKKLCAEESLNSQDIALRALLNQH